MNENTDARLLRLHPADNVLTVTATIEAGAQICVGCATVAVAVRLPIGHKVAAQAIAAGERIVKYGAPIGSAVQAFSAGEHVHTHNLKSDYLPTFSREDQARFFAQQQQPQQ